MFIGVHRQLSFEKKKKKMTIKFYEICFMVIHTSFQSSTIDLFGFSCEKILSRLLSSMI